METVAHNHLNPMWGQVNAKDSLHDIQTNFEHPCVGMVQFMVWKKTMAWRQPPVYFLRLEQWHCYQYILE